jgi:hypothetical protein
VYGWGAVTEQHQANSDAESSSPRRLHWLARERVLLYPSLSLLAFVIVSYAIWVFYTFPNLVDPKGTPLGLDFLAFWGAARLAVEGRPEAAYDWDALTATYRAALPALREIRLLWHYPPTFLLVVLPLGLLPYLAALGVFVAATVAFWATLIRRMFDNPIAWIVAAAFPAGLLNFLNGQNGFLTAGLAGFAFLALDRRPALAGVSIGLLAIKPHLAVLFPLALFTDRQWRAIAAAAATALAFTGLSIAVLGWATMQAFLLDLPAVTGLIDAGRQKWFQIPSIYVFALSLGLPPRAALGVHALVALGAAGGVWAAWRAPEAPREAKFAALGAASLLVSPYVFFYDLTWAGRAIAWLVKLGMRRGFGRGEREFLAAAFIVSALPIVGYHITGVQLGWVLPLALTSLGTWKSLRRQDLPRGELA